MNAPTIHARALMAAALVAGLAVGAAAQAPTTPVSYTATAVNVDPSVNLTATTVFITVDRWSTDDERDKLLDTAGAGGQDALLKSLQGLPKAGSIRTPDSVTFDVRYARHIPSEHGGSQIVLVTDRNISFFEAANAARTADYPFMVIELRMNPSGEGEGRITVATKITANPANNHIMLENYGSQPVQLTRVRQVEPDEQ
jgi:hypothetical protein